MRLSTLLPVTAMSRPCARRLTSLAGLAALSLVACSSTADPPATNNNPGGGNTSNGASTSTPTAGNGQPVGTGGANTGTGGTASAVSGAGGAPVASGGTTGAGGLPPLPHPTNSDHCLYGYSALPSDDTMQAGPAIYENGGSKDTILQPEVLKWMADNKWTGAHVVWHAVRGCMDGSAAGLLRPLGFPDICKDYPVLIPADQNCKTAGDGYQFLLFHRHMMQALKQLWPKHAADFDGFPKFPTKKEELPVVWNEKDPTWSQTILDAAAIGDNIEQHLDKFPDEGTLGYWLQCPVGAKASFAPNIPYVGLHFNLHDQWSRGASSPHGLNNGQVNITNYMFWKLHGWIDKVWEKYRVAKGLTVEGSPAMTKYKQDMQQACNEMDLEVAILQQTPGSGPQLDCPPDVDEKGDFHTKVRPIFESDKNRCAGCHGPSQTSPYVDLTLGGQVSSKCIVERLKRESKDGGQFKLVEPGQPDKSYLYLKAAGTAATAGCTPTDPNKPCNTAEMPPSGRTMSDAELEVLRKWIADGANYP
jgi:hypothetical protein